MLSAGKELRVSVQLNEVQMLTQLSRPVAAKELFSPASHWLFPHRKAAINHPPVTSLLRGDIQHWNRFPKGLSVSLATFLQGKEEPVELSKSLDYLFLLNTRSTSGSRRLFLIDFYVLNVRCGHRLQDDGASPPGFTRMTRGKQGERGLPCCLY